MWIVFVLAAAFWGIFGIIKLHSSCNFRGTVESVSESPQKRAKMEAEAYLRRISSFKIHKGMLFAAAAVFFLSFVGRFFLNESRFWVARYLWTASLIIFNIFLVFFFVVLSHEVGHLLAMRAFGYSNTSVLFMPELDALTAGGKRNASPLQRLVVYLAGPVLVIMLSGILLPAVKQPMDNWNAASPWRTF